uniref:Uncharacterized protein n=1 Tax=Otus sunia TaxID=257818 RepID=A0A8C8E9P1_9STRI
MGWDPHHGVAPPSLGQEPPQGPGPSCTRIPPTDWDPHPWGGTPIPRASRVPQWWGGLGGDPLPTVGGDGVLWQWGSMDGGAGGACTSLLPPPPPVPGKWAAWGSWSPCDAKCGGGVRSRVRSCSDPPPKNGGQPCPGGALQSQPLTCEDVACALACGWSAWSPWTRCDGGCGMGTQERFRWGAGGAGESLPRGNGLGSAPQTGRPHGSFRQVAHQPCGSRRRSHLHRGGPGGARVPPGLRVRLSPAEPGAGWSAWTPWSECSAPCGSGEQRRHRACAAPAPGGPDCAGPHVQTRDCNPWPCRGGCPVPGPVATCHAVPWGAMWCHGVPCSAAPIPPVPSCSPSHSAEAPWGAWSPWGPCSVSCGGGERLRRRQCQGPACPGLGLQSQMCNTHVCRGECCPPPLPPTPAPHLCPTPPR